MGFWDEACGELPPKRCGNCAHCTRYARGRTWSFDPFQWVGDGEQRRELYGICEQPGEQPVEVLLSAIGEDTQPCGGEGWERRI